MNPFLKKNIRPGAFVMSLMISFASPLRAEATDIKNIVLVHGAFADGSSWSAVIPLLQADGYHVTAVQNPLTSLQDDVTATEPRPRASEGRRSSGGAFMGWRGYYPCR